MQWEPLEQSLSPQQQALLPTDQDVAFYRQHGWFVTPPVIPDDVIEQAIAGAERYYQGERDAVLPVNEGFSDWQPRDGLDLVRNNEFVSLQVNP